MKRAFHADAAMVPGTHYSLLMAGRWKKYSFSRGFQDEQSCNNITERASVMHDVVLSGAGVGWGGEMKRIILAATVFCMFPAVVHAQIYGLQNDSTPKITVQGEALVKVTPDKVTVILGIETWDKDIGEAKKQNSEILRRTVDSIKSMGVEGKDVRTDHLSIEPRYDSGYKKENFIGYFVRNSLSVSMRAVDKVEQLLTEVLSAGVTHIHGVNFSTSEFRKHREEARRLALEAAKEKALKMSQVLGKTIGDPLQVHEQQQYSRWYYNGGWWGHGRGQSMSQNVVQNAGGESADISDTIALGTISIRGSVSVSFELK